MTQEKKKEDMTLEELLESLPKLTPEQEAMLNKWGEPIAEYGLMDLDEDERYWTQQQESQKSSSTEQKTISKPLI